MAHSSGGVTECLLLSAEFYKSPKYLTKAYFAVGTFSFVCISFFLISAVTIVFFCMATDEIIASKHQKRVN